MKPVLAISAVFILACADEIGSGTATLVGNPNELRIQYAAHVRGSSGSRDLYDFSTPQAAYSAGRSELVSLCGGLDSNCASESVILLNADIATSVIARGQYDLLTSTYGFAAVYGRLADGTTEVLSFATNGDMRGTDAEATLQNVEALNSAATGISGQLIDALDWLKYDVRRLPARFAFHGEQAHGTQRRNLAATRLAVERAQPVVQEYERQVASARTEFGALIQEYTQLRSDEAGIVSELAQISEQSSEASLQDIVGIRTRLAALVSEHGARPVLMMIEVSRVQGRLAGIQDDLERELGYQNDTLEGRGVTIEVPNLTQEAHAVSVRMVEYLEASQEQFSAAVTGMLTDLEMRQEALLMAERDAATKETVAAAATARAAAEFLAEATSGATQLWAPQPEVNGIELLATRYQNIVAFLQTRALCSLADAPAWHADGCLVYRRNWSRARIYTETTLPRTLRRNASSLEARGASPESVESLRASIDSGDLASAVTIHDLLANRTE